MKNQKGFIQMPILIAIIAGILVLSGASYVGVKQYKNYQAEKIVQEKEKQEMQKEKEKQETEMADLKTKLTELENKPAPKPQIIYNTIEKTTEKIIEQPKERSVADITKEWSPIVVYVLCEWHYDNGIVSAKASGSGFLTVFSGGTIAVMTNKHVLLNKGLFTAAFCDTYFLNGEKYRILWSDVKSGYGINPNYDIGSITIYGISTYLKNLVTRREGYYCSTEPEIGDEIVVLGYPGIGSNSGITVTEGIISGYEGGYYVTSAKIDHGNSGGIAVSVKNNCIVGMPSAAVTGSIESLGRILSAKTILAQ